MTTTTNEIDATDWLVKNLGGENQGGSLIYDGNEINVCERGEGFVAYIEMQELVVCSKEDLLNKLQVRFQ